VRLRFSFKSIKNKTRETNGGKERGRKKTVKKKKEKSRGFPLIWKKKKM